ncbi:hypothetical protein ACHAQJ_001949 [Trichoderma viride]
MRLPHYVRGRGRQPVSFALHSRRDIISGKTRHFPRGGFENLDTVSDFSLRARVSQLQFHLLFSRYGRRPVKRRGFNPQLSFMDNNLSQPEQPLGVSGENRFVYKPLRDSQCVRFLILQPGSGSDPLVGSLQVGSLDSADIEQLPPYEAISYVWGTGGRQFKFICDGDTLPLTQSIHDALSRVRLPDQPRRLWADQICINQENLEERSKQVRLMNSVYKNAQKVLVWLGRDEEGVAADAVRTVHYLDGVFKDDKAHEKFKVAHEEDLLMQSPEPWIPLAKLTKLSWFQRIWIVQEIGTTAPATLFWGDTELDWDMLSFVAGILNERYHHLRTRFLISTSSIRYLRRRFVEPDTDYDQDHNRGNFAYELHRARHLCARDPRDHVYAFLGHYSISKGGKELQSLTVDYSKSLKDVYVDVAVRSLRGAKDLLMLAATHHGKPQTKRRAPWKSEDLGLPSWVPDWRHLPIHILGSPTAPHRASKDTKPDLIIDEDSRILHIRGVRVEVVERTSWTIYGTSFQVRQEGQEKKKRRVWGIAQPQGNTRPPSSNNITNENDDDNDDPQQQQNHPLHQRRQSQSDQYGPRAHVMEILWRRVCGYGSFDLSRVYPPFLKNAPAAKSPSPSPSTSPQDFQKSALFAFLQTLTNACTGIDRTRPYSTIPSEQWLASGAAYLVRYALQSSPSSPSPSPSPSPASTTLSPSQTFPSFPSKSLGNTDSNSGSGSGNTMASFFEKANSLSSRQYTHVSPDISQLVSFSKQKDPFKWSHEAVLVTRYRRFAITREGYFVLGPDALQQGDVVAVLRGGKTPFLLRRVRTSGDADTDTQGRWILVGECYVHGLMDGEGWDVEGVEEEVFSIQ